ncbi:hypothetical protein [Tenacibaculum aiptasiae]|uniref:hypothetical protein n=1 Tax=Tenacibaculum aiptasiae TaxID=426481 RepID=UPI0023309770|nr:hypothetical protein [Tenacibaculum aiptasiae]
MKLRAFLREWLGVERNSKDIEYENEKVNRALAQTKSNNSLIKGNQKQITQIKNKIKKH